MSRCVNTNTAFQVLLAYMCCRNTNEASDFDSDIALIPDALVFLTLQAATVKLVLKNIEWFESI